MKKCYSIFVLSLLLMLFQAQGQITNAVTYDFTDGSIILAKESPDGKLKLGGAYNYHSANYGLNLKVNQQLTIDVDGSCTVRFLGSQYSSLNLEGTAMESGDLGEHNTQVKNDLSDTFDFLYSGPATTLTFVTVPGSGNDLYLPQIEVIPVQAGKDFTTAEKNIAYYFDLRDESIVTTSDPGNVKIEKGLFTIDAGCCNAYSVHGTQHGINYKPGNKISLQVAGNSKIRFAGDQYSGGTTTASSDSGSFDIIT